MELERRDIPPAPILPPKKAKRRRKKETQQSDTVIIIDVLPPRVVCEYPVGRAASGTGSTAGSQAGAGGARGQNVVFIGMVAVVVLVLGAAIFQPDAVKTATEFFGAIGKVLTTAITKP